MTTPNFKTIESDLDIEKASGQQKNYQMKYADMNRQYLQEEPIDSYQHSEVLHPLILKSGDFVDPNRVVLYREDCREIPFVQDDRSPSPRAVVYEETKAYFVIEISHSKNRVYILGVLIPQHLVYSVI